MAKKPAKVAKKKQAKKPAKVGRPEVYSNEIVDKICKLIATGNKGLQRLCREYKDIPHFDTMYRWLSDPAKYKYFTEQYARAKELQADFLADEIIEISDEKVIGSKTIHKIGGKNGDVIENHTGLDQVERSKLKVEARKWTAAKLRPKKYGNKIDVTTDGKEIKQVDLGAMISKFMDNEGNAETKAGS